MILRRLTLVLAAAAVMATSASVATVALAFALYALVVPYVGAAGAGAVVAGAAALMLAIIAMIFSGPRMRRESSSSVQAGSLVERAFSLARDRPVVAIAAALGVGFMVIRNPRYLGAAVRAFVEGRETPPPPL